MEYSSIKEIDDCIDEFFPMKEGAIIPGPNKKISLFCGVYISRRALKHIVERRSGSDGMDAFQIKSFFKKAVRVIADPEVSINNHARG